MAKSKVIDATSCWKNFVKIVKAIRPLANGVVKTDRNELFLKMKDGTYHESFVLIKDSTMTPFYQWLCTDLDTMLGQLDAHSIKVKGTFVSENEHEVSIFKDMEKKISLTKLPIIQNRSYREQSYSLYKRIPEFYEKLLSSETKWVNAGEDTMDAIREKRTIHAFISFMDPSEYVGNVEMILSNNDFPLGAKMLNLEFCLLKADREDFKYYIGMREEYDDFFVYSVIAIMMIDDD